MNKGLEMAKNNDNAMEGGKINKDSEAKEKMTKLRAMRKKKV